MSDLLGFRRLLEGPTRKVYRKMGLTINTQIMIERMYGVVIDMHPGVSPTAARFK